MILICDEYWQCASSTIKCPEYGNCHIICSAEGACSRADIIWSDQFVQSTLTCNDTYGLGNECLETTEPPNYYEYIFNDIYSISQSQNLANNIQITREFELYLELKIDESSYNTSNQSIISILDDMNIEVMDLSINNKNGLIQMRTIGDIHLIEGVISKDNEYHSVNIIFNENSQIIFKIDDVVHLNLISHDSNSLFSSLYTNNKSYSLHVGRENNYPFTSNITNIAIKISLPIFYETSDDITLPTDMGTCYQIADELPRYFTNLVATYLDGTMILGYLTYLYTGHLSDTNPITFEDVPWNLDMYTIEPGDSQSWTQIANKLYFVAAHESEDDGSAWYFVLDVSSKDLVRLSHPSNIYINISFSLCHNVTHLFVHTMGNIAMYEIDSGSWTNLLPSISLPTSVSCQIYHNKMYIFGGYDNEYEHSNSIYEYDTTLGSIYHLNVTLSDPARSIRSTQQNEYIYLYGGETNFGEPIKLQIFNAVTHTLFISSDDTIHDFVAGFVDDIQRKVMIDSHYIYYYQDDEIWLDFNLMMNQFIHPGDAFIISFDIKKCHPKSSESFNFTLKSDDNVIRINHVVVVQNGICKNVCWKEICDSCTSGIVPLILPELNITSFTMSVTSTTERIKLYQSTIKIKIAPTKTFHCIMDQTISPGDALNIDLNTSGCHFNTIQLKNSSSLNMTLKSYDPAIGINHNLIVENGTCEQICDLYEICNPCSSGITPIISTQSNINNSFEMYMTAVLDGLTLFQSNIIVWIDECAIGLGYNDDAILSDCVNCPINSFKITKGNEPCFECKEQNGFSCDGLSLITTHYNLWLTGYKKETGKFMTPFDITYHDNISIYAMQCPPQFCCQSQSGCTYLDSSNLENDILCAQHRDYSTPLCSRCVYGYYEQFGSTACGECDDLRSLLWIIPITVAAALLVAFLFYDSKPADVSIYLGKEKNHKQIIKRDELTAMTIMIFKVLMYYYQSLSQVLYSQSIVNSLLPLVSFFSLSLEYNSSSNSGICVIPFMPSPLLKILMSPLFVALMIFNMCWIGLVSHLCYKKKANTYKECGTLHQLTTVETISRKPVINVVVLKIFVMTAGILLGMAFKLLSCITMTGTKNIVHSYDATATCFDQYWFIGFILCIVVVLFFVGLFFRIYYQELEERMSPYNTYRNIVKPFKEKYWWFEFVLFSRRFLIALFTSFRSIIVFDINIVLSVLLVLYLILHCGTCPFKYQRLNVVETVCLGSLVIISSAISRIDTYNKEFSDVVIGFAIIVPFLFIFYYTFKALSLLYSSQKNSEFSQKELKQIEKIKSRSQFGTNDNDTSENKTEKHNMMVVEEKNEVLQLDEIEIQTVRVANIWDNIDRNVSILSGKESP
eukprot:447524_1